MNRSRLTSTIIAALAAFVVPVGLLNAPGLHAAEPTPETVPGPNLVVNGDFVRGTDGWKVNNARTTDLDVATTSSGYEAVLTATSRSNIVLNDRLPTVRSFREGARYRVAATVRAVSGWVGGHVRVREVASAGTTTHAKYFRARDAEWFTVTFDFTARRSGSHADLNVVGYGVQAGAGLRVRDVSLREYVPADEMPVRESGESDEEELPGADDEGTPASDRPRQEPPTGEAGRDCRLTERGVPPCGALVGATYGANSDPAPFEEALGHRLGIRRTFWGPGQVTSAVRTAREDLEAGRLPWMSFKLGHSWSQMASGAGDDWVRDLADRLRTVDGPVWVAFHHEPEGDGDIAQWTAMQERLGPILRSRAPNVGFTVILTGWHQLYGEKQYALESLWPDTEVDVAGFDIYYSYGTVKNGVQVTKKVDIGSAYFAPIAAWAERQGVAWGLAETAVSDKASEDLPTVLRDHYDALVKHGGVAYSYFNTSLNSKSSWQITTARKQEQFRDVIASAPRPVWK